MNYRHVKQNKNIDPGLSDFFIGIVPEFVSIKKPEAPFTEPGDQVRIKTAHEFKPGKGFIRCYQVKKRHGGKGDTSGSFGAKSFANEFDIFIPGMNPEQMEFVKNIINEEVITLHRDADCGLDQVIQLGDNCKPAEIDVNYTTGTFEPTGEKGFFLKVKWTGIPKFYEGTIALLADGESSSGEEDLRPFSIFQFSDLDNDRTAVLTGTGDGTVDWGDGNTTEVSGSNWTATHVYDDAPEPNYIAKVYSTSITELYCSSSDLTNIDQLHSGLVKVGCYNTSIASLPELASTLKFIELVSNPITELPTLNDGLESLQINNSLINALGVLPEGLQLLNCDGNQITELPSLPASLTSLSCLTNLLTELPALPSGLSSLSASNNSLAELPALPANLTALVVNANNLTEISSLPSSLLNFQCNNNSLTTLPLIPNLFNFRCESNLLTSSDINSFLSQLVAHGRSNATFRSINQSPSAPPSGAGITDKATLISRGWTVTTD